MYSMILYAFHQPVLHDRIDHHRSHHYHWHRYELVHLEYRSIPSRFLLRRPILIYDSPLQLYPNIQSFVDEQKSTR
jgi:hypothetical protein